MVVRHSRGNPHDASSAMETPITSIVALGSPHGDDQVGWEVAQQLQTRLGGQMSGVIRIERVTTPWDFVSWVQQTMRMILIDACQTGALAGTIHQWQPHQLNHFPRRCASSHGGSLPQALEMAAQLGRLPAKITIVAIEGTCFSPGDPLSPAVKRAIPIAVEHILAILAEELPSCTNTPSFDHC